MASRQFTSDQRQIQQPSYRPDSRMKNYQVVFDDSVQNLRCGFYTNSLKDVVFDQSDTQYTVEPGTEHRLDLISLKFYDSALYDWVIADANNISDPIKGAAAGTKLIIPNRMKIR